MCIDYQEVAKRIIKRRRQLGMRQVDLVEKADFSDNYVSQLETERLKPSLESIVKLCTALDVTPDYLLLGVTTQRGNSENVKQKLKLLNDKQLDFLSEFIDLLVDREI